MTRYLFYKLKGLASDRSVLFWSVGFMLFWAVMWVYVFTRVDEPRPPREVLEYVLKVNAALAYTYLGVLSMGSLAIGLTQHKLVSSSAAAFAVRFTKLKPFRYMLEDFVAAVVALVYYVSVTVSAVICLTYLRFEVVALPEKPLELLAYMLLAGFTWYWLSYLLSLVMLVLRKPRSQPLGMIPLIVGFGIYSTLWLDPGSVVYVIPVAPLAPLIVSAASGVKPVTGGWFYAQPWRGTGANVTTIEPPLALAATCAWVFLLALTSLLLMRRVSGVPVEEAVQTG